MLLLLVASCYYTSKALVTSSDALVPSSEGPFLLSVSVRFGVLHTLCEEGADFERCGAHFW